MQGCRDSGGSRVWGLGFGVWIFLKDGGDEGCLGVEQGGRGFGFWVLGFGFWVLGFGFGVSIFLKDGGEEGRLGVEQGGRGFGFRVLGLGFGDAWKTAARRGVLGSKSWSARTRLPYMSTCTG
jgi:hypothetical protein